MDISPGSDLEAGLRLWAFGSTTDEAAVELVIRSGWARRPGFAAHCTDALDDRLTFLDWDIVGGLLDDRRDSSIHGASSGEMRILRIAHSLACGLLADTVPGLDCNHMDLVLAALVHANGCSEPGASPSPRRSADGSAKA